MQFGLKEKIIDQINYIFAKYMEVEQVILYGSRAIGNFKNGSDIDLVLKGEALNPSVTSKISNDLDDLLIPYSFDISIFNEISNPDLIEHINRVGIVFYKKGMRKK